MRKTEEGGFIVTFTDHRVEYGLAMNPHGVEVGLSIKHLIEKGLAPPIYEELVVDAIRLKIVKFYDYANKSLDVFIPKDFTTCPIPRFDVKKSTKRLRRKIRV